MSVYRDIAYRLDPVPWVRQVLGVTPTAWQEEFLRAPRGASIAALTARQVGKTTTHRPRRADPCSSRSQWTIGRRRPTTTGRATRPSASCTELPRPIPSRSPSWPTCGVPIPSHRL